MSRVRSILVVVVLAAPLTVSRATTTATGPIFGLIAPVHVSRSANWAGYQQGVMEHGEMFTQVSASWRVPRAVAHQPGTPEASALWAGIGGGCPDPACTVPAVDPTLIQAGTEHDVAADGSATYYAWWEVLPLPSVRTNLDVEPGDAMFVDIRGNHVDWTITIVNQTTGASVVEQTKYPAAMTTAEWVLEAPTMVGTVGPAPMPDLDAVRFEAARANDHGANLESLQAVSMIDTRGATLATPSPPGAGADNFTVCQWVDMC